MVRKILAIPLTLLLLATLLPAPAEAAICAPLSTPPYIRVESYTYLCGSTGGGYGSYHEPAHTRGGTDTSLSYASIGLVSVKGDFYFDTKWGGVGIERLCLGPRDNPVPCYTFRPIIIDNGCPVSPWTICPSEYVSYPLA